VRWRHHEFCAAAGGLEEIRRLRADEIEDVGGKLLTKVRTVTEVVRLDSYLVTSAGTDQRYFRMVVANAGIEKLALLLKKFLAKTKSLSRTWAKYLLRC